MDNLSLTKKQKQCNGEKLVLSTDVEQMDINVQKTKNASRHKPYPFHKIQLRINHRCKCEMRNYKIHRR